MPCTTRRVAHMLALVILLLTTLGLSQSHALGEDAERGVAELALSVDGLGGNDTPCPRDPWPARRACLVAHRYAGDARAEADVTELAARHGVVVGIERAHTMDGGFRGLLELVPEWPIGRHRRHLAAILAAHDDIEATLVALGRGAPQPIRYRHRGVVYRFFRSVGRTTPSAYASSWTIGFNVSGSLHRNADAIRGTLAHEIFHLNDQAAGTWSLAQLGEVHARILARCGTSRRCLAPYAPTSTTVRGGTYYAFQPDNGASVMEYGAEIAARYLDEHRQLLRTGRLARPAFKCGPEENAIAYARVATAFFGGVDRTRCARSTLSRAASAR